VNSSRSKTLAFITQSKLTRLTLLTLIVGLVLAAPAAVMGYRFYRSQPSYLIREGAKAVERGDLAEAERLADRLQRKGHDAAAHLLHGRILLSQAKAQMQKAPPPFPYEGIQRASQMVLSGTGIPAYPHTLRALVWLTAVQVQQPFPQRTLGVGKLLEALAEFTQVLDDDPWAAEATVLASECLVRLGDYRSAKLALATLINRQPDNFDAHRYLAAIYIDVNATTLAIPHLREWIRLDANDPRPYRWLSHITRYTETGYPQAIEAYRKLLQLNLDDSERAEVGMELAEIQIAKLADYQQAFETLAQVPQGSQDQPAMVLLRAECLLGLGQGDEAGRLVDALLKKQPTLTSALLFRAKVYLQDDQPKLAIPLLEDLVSRHPDNPSARQTLMLAYRSIRDERRADEQKQILDSQLAPRKRFNELQKVAARDPWNGRARLEMAMLSSAANYSEALAWIRFALASSPEDPRIRKTWTQLVGYQPPLLLREYQRRRQVEGNQSSVAGFRATP
jgi:tetratricopeptide (TPR) repeat protein